MTKVPIGVIGGIILLTVIVGDREKVGDQRAKVWALHEDARAAAQTAPPPREKLRREVSRLLETTPLRLPCRASTRVRRHDESGGEHRADDGRREEKHSPGDTRGFHVHRQYLSERMREYGRPNLLRCGAGT